MTGSRYSLPLARLTALGFVASVGAVALGGTAFAATSGYNNQLVSCQVASLGNGQVEVSAIGFDPLLPTTTTTSSGSTPGTTFTATGLPAGTVFTATVSGSLADGTKQSCSSSVIIGGTPATVAGAVSPALAGGGGTATLATAPVSFTAPVSVAGTTTVKPKKVSVLGESISKSSGTSVKAPAAASSTGKVTAPGSTLAFTGADGVVTTGIVGLSLVSAGGAFVVASRKRSRRSRRSAA